MKLALEMLEMIYTTCKRTPTYIVLGKVYKSQTTQDNEFGIVHVKLYCEGGDKHLNWQRQFMGGEILAFF